MENPIKMDDLGVPLFLETPIYTSGLVFDRCVIWGSKYRSSGAGPGCLGVVGATETILQSSPKI